MTTSVYGDGEAGFWGEISPCQHLVQFYEADDVFMDTLLGFVAGGLSANESVIIIATPLHRRILDARLREIGLDPKTLRERDQYIALDAEETLESFMSDGWPD